MEIFCEGLTKKFGSQKIFNNLNLHIPYHSSIAITGSNGAGKSTLLKILAQLSFPDKGNVIYRKASTVISSEDVPNHVAFCAPYQELPLHLTLNELIQFHIKSRPCASLHNCLDQCGLTPFLERRIESFSSGMIQRVKLSLAFSTKSDLLFLDEPTSNLDKQGKAFYRALCNQQIGNKTIVISSNEEAEYDFSDQIINIESISR